MRQRRCEDAGNRVYEPVRKPGRAAGYHDTQGFTLVDALENGLGCLGIPVIYDADIGHVPPQMQIINGAYGTVDFEHGGIVVYQEMT